VGDDKYVIVCVDNKLPSANPEYCSALCWRGARDRASGAQQWVRPELATTYTADEAKAVVMTLGAELGMALRAMTLRDARIYCDAGLTASELEDTYSPEGYGQFPDYTREDWKLEVANDDTVAGYWLSCVSWIEQQWSEQVWEELRATAAEGPPAPGMG
jgi:hypothetical protein